jgi:predicted cupin superfamily sugar epimerase
MARDPFAAPLADDLLVGEAVAARLRLNPLPHEGGLFRETYRDDQSSAIYFMLLDGMVSALHRLSGDEVYHWYAGAPLRLLLLHPAGRVEAPVLGNDIAAGHVPQLRVPRGVWQGSSSEGAWTLVGTTMAPPFDWLGFELAPANLAEQYPKVAARVAALLPRA